MLFLLVSHMQANIPLSVENDKKQMINGWSPFGKQTVSTEALSRKKRLVRHDRANLFKC